VTRTIIAELNLPYSPSELADHIAVTSPLSTVLLDITVMDTSAIRARDIANAISVEFPRLIDRIETLPGHAASPVKVSVTRDAELPTEPVVPRTRLNAALGLAAGLALGVAVALLRHLLDRTIHGKREIAEAADASVVGEVTDDGMMKKRPLIVDDQATPRAEAFRTLRTNIRFLSVDEKLSSFVVTGSLPNEGKTTVAANLAIALAQAGEPVVLIDADLRKPSLANMFALSGGVGLTNVLLGDVPINHAMQHWREDLPLYIVTSGPIPPNPSELLGSHRLEKVLASLKASKMTVIFDSPPLLPVTDAAILARATRGALVVTRVGSTKTDQLGAAVDALRAVDAAVLGVVANRVKGKKKSAYGSYYTAQPSGWKQAARPAASTATIGTPAARSGALHIPTQTTPSLDEEEQTLPGAVIGMPHGLRITGRRESNP
jgi:capsular exopolysaccharide synthesis family protein